MTETAVLVVVEVVSVQDVEGLRAYAARASQLIGSAGGVLLGKGGSPLDGEAGFAPLVIEYWPSEGAFRAWINSETYRPLDEIRRASTTMRVAIVPLIAGPEANLLGAIA